VITKSSNFYNLILDGSYTGGRWDYESSEVRLWNKPFWNFNLYGEYKLDKSYIGYDLKPFIKIKNVLNDERQEILNFDSPGRTVFFGLKGNI
jgi:outer membrane receptor protein involved in Fe transport